MLDHIGLLGIVGITVALMALIVEGAAYVRARLTAKRETAAKTRQRLALITDYQRQAARERAQRGEDRRPLADRVAADVRSRLGGRYSESTLYTTSLSVGPKGDNAA